MAKRRPAAAKSSQKDLKEGTVVRVDSRMCRVATDDGEIDCRIRGILFRREKRCTRPVAVGDRVRFDASGDPPAVIVEVLPRNNELARPKIGSRREQVIAANLDQAVLVGACAEPGLNLRLFDRMLVACERNDYRALIVCNKVDLIEEIDELIAVVDEVYGGLDYEIIPTSVKTGEGIERLRAELVGRISVFAGMSGVGKSALLTACYPQLALKSGVVSEATGKGKHTTTHVSLLPLDEGGYVVDTPGIREFGVVGMDPEDVCRFFVDFLPFVDKCRFRRCTHDHEVGCAVKDAVDSGEIHEFRFDSYLRILESMREDRAH